MMPERDYEKFKDLTFEDFKRLALEEGLSGYEKIGFPDEFRAGKEEAIFADITSKMAALSRPGSVILDLGCGCSGLAHMVIEQCGKTGNTLLLVDSEEMLSLLPDEPFIEKHACRFPDCPGLMDEYAGAVDGILVYSVLQHVFLEASVFDFLDRACTLLAEGGEMLLGDIPNVSKRKRFFSSSTGVQFHKEFTGGDEAPVVEHLTVERGKIDDGVVFAIMLRYRAAGFDTYLLEQGEGLPMANRREDILIRRP